MGLETALAAAGAWWIPLLLYVLVVADAFFPPIPSEALYTGLAAIAVTTRVGSLPLLVVVGFAGCLTGDLLAWAVGRRIDVESSRLLSGPRARRLVAWARGALDTRMASFVLITRFLPGGRTAADLSCGAFDKPLARFAPVAVAASAVWSAYTAALGVGAGRWLPGNPLAAAAVGIVVGLTLGTGLDLVSRVWRRRRTVRCEP